MSNDAYRAEFAYYEKGIVKYKPSNIIILSTEAKYVIPIETQDWIVATVTPLYEEHKVKKVAVIMSSDFITQLSFEQVVEEIEEEENTKILFFDDEEKATNWLEGKDDSEEKAA